MPFQALEEHAKGCENEVGAEFAGKQHADRSGAEGTQSGEFQHDHLKTPLFVGRMLRLDCFRSTSSECQMVSSRTRTWLNMSRDDQADGGTLNPALQVCSPDEDR